MIKELRKDNKVDWNEKITIELTLADLQLLYDCIGAVPWHYVTLRHKDTSFKSNAENISGSSLYDNLEDILAKHNGLIDYEENNLNLNLNLTLETID